MGKTRLAPRRKVKELDVINRNGEYFSFHVRRRSGRTDDEAMTEMLDRAAAWIAEAL